MCTSFLKGGHTDNLHYKLAMHTNKKGNKSYDKKRTCNNEEPQEKYQLGTVNNKLLTGLNIFHDASIQNISKSFSPRESFLPYQWIITENI